MPYRPKDIYRGHRKFRSPLSILLFVVAFLVVAAIGMFYFLQQYIVYDASGVRLQLPFGREEETPAAEGEPAPTPTFEPLAVEVIWEDPDFEDVDMGGWEDLEPVQDRFIAMADVVNPQALAEAVASVTGGDFYSGAILQVKDTSGQLAWTSSCATAVSYGTWGVTDLTGTIATLHEAGKTVAAQISCFVDNMLCARNPSVALQSGGYAYRDDSGNAWVDPYNRTIRTYVIDLAQELAAMGFDEVILADFYHPISEAGFTYTVTLRTPANPVVAVCQLGKRVAEALAGTGTAVSARLNAASLRNGQAAQTGQDLDIFWRLFARLYCPSGPDILASDMELATESMNAGDANVRFVPIMGLMPEEHKSFVISW